MLISNLSTRVITLPFTGIETLLTQSDFKIAVKPGTSFVDAFKHSTNPVWQAAWTNRIEPYLNDYNDYFEYFDGGKKKKMNLKNSRIIFSLASLGVGWVRVFPLPLLDGSTPFES